MPSLGTEKVTTSQYIGTNTTSQPRKMLNFWVIHQWRKRWWQNAVSTIMK